MTLRRCGAVPRARRVSAAGMLLLAVAGLCAARPAAAQQSANEVAVWQLETTYWNDVKSVDLEGYRALWHKDFVGWPYSSAQPVRKDHITDWITGLTGKGLRKFAGQRVEVVGGSSGGGLTIKGGLWPAPTGGARGVALDPAQAAIANQQARAGGTAADVPEFKVAKVRIVPGACD